MSVVEGESLVEAWRDRLARSTCYASGLTHILGPLGYRVLAGRAFADTFVMIAIGIAMLSLPWIPTITIRTRSLLLLALAAATLATLGSRLVFTPITVTVSCAFITITALLLGRRVVYTALALQLVAALVRSAIPLSALDPDLSLIDPTRFASWVRVTVNFTLIAGVVAFVLRQLVQLVGVTFAGATRDLALATTRLEASRRTRDARVHEERELRVAQKVQAVVQLSGGLAHLLNNALMVVRSGLEDVRTDTSLTMRERVAAIVVRTSERVAAAVRGLMTFSRKREGTARHFDLVAWLDTLVHELGTTLPDNVGIRVQGAEGLMVDFGPDRLRQLVVNLVLNGADALAANGGEIRISALPVVDETGATIGVDLVIEDNGVGMTTELATRARAVFFTTKDDRHAGLGLTIAIGIVEQAGRTLQLASAPGVGTRVTVPLPATREPTPHSDPVLAFLLPDELPEMVVDPPTARVSTPSIVEPSAAPDRWIDQMTTRYARVGAAIVALACGVLAVAHATYLMLVLVPLLALGGWVPGLQRASRVLWFGGALIVTGFASIALLSYLAGTVVLLVAAIVWVALFAPRSTLVPVLALIGAGLLGIGWLFHVETLLTPEHVMTTHPTSLILSAIVATLLELAIVQFVLATVDHAQRGVMSMRAARRQLQAAQDEEDAEGVRRLQRERDVTRSERMAATGRAVSTVAHDLNNALFGLMSAAEELAVPVLRPDEIAQAIEDLWGSFNHARALALQFAVTDEASPVTTVVDVSAVVQRTLRALQSIVGGAIALDTEVASGCFVAIADDDLRRLLFNLVTNARDSIAGAGTVTVTLRAVDDGRVRVDVRDTGRGMDEATRARLSEAFFTTKPEGQGTGLGLHSVARIVARTQGQLAIDSTPGCGTNVTVSWPAATAPGPTVAPSVRALGVEDSSTMIGTVIVAEDEPLVRALLVRTLERAGYVVRACEDGDRALAIVDELATCVALCIDGVMPGRPTADVIEAFHRKHPGRPVVLCSGHLPADLQQRGLLGPGVTFLAKPFSPGRLRDVLANLVGSAA